MAKPSRLVLFMQDLKRRKVFQVGSVYLVAAWGASLGAAELFPAFGIPDWAVRFFVITAMMGFPLALTLAWAFEITPDGIVIDEGSSRGPIGTGTETVWEAQSTLQIIWEDRGGKHQVDMQKEFLIGRDESADLIVDEPKVSRRHTRVFPQQDRWLVEDLNSRNGTRLNGTLIQEPTKLAATNEMLLFDGGNAIRLRVFDTHAVAVTELE